MEEILKLDGWIWKCPLELPWNEKWIPGNLTSCLAVAGDKGLYRQLEDSVYTSSPFWDSRWDVGMRDWRRLIDPIARVYALAYIIILTTFLYRVMPGLPVSRISGKVPISSELLMRYIFEFVVIVVPVIFCINPPFELVGNEGSFFSAVLLVVVSVGLLRSASDQFLGLRLPTDGGRWSLGGCFDRSIWRSDKGRQLHMHHLRGYSMIISIIGILSVDFWSFPREFAKSDHYGYSEMDCGVGYTLFITGALAGPKLHSRGVGPTVMRLFPVWIVGALAFSSKLGVDYHVPTSEYGVHWNFFFTVGVVTTVSAIIAGHLISPSRTWILGCIMLIGYEMALSLFGLDEYILSAPRTGFFSANREGICGSIGFLALYLVSMSVGVYLLSFKGSMRRQIVEALTLSIFLFAGIIVAHVGGGLLPSRRMVNLQYCLATGLNLAILIQLELAATAIASFVVQGHPRQCLIIEAISGNQLPVFLLANVLTGIVKMSNKTLLQPYIVSIAIAISYSAVVCFGSVALQCLRGFD